MLTETVLESISLRYVSSIVRPSPLPFLIPFAFLFVFGLVVLPKMLMLTIITSPPKHPRILPSRYACHNVRQGWTIRCQAVGRG